MAVQDYLTNYTALNGTVPPIEGQGVKAQLVQKTVSIAAADDNNSEYVILRKVNPCSAFARLEVENTAITDGTDFNIGIYDSETGEPIVENALADALDLSSAHSKVAPLDGLENVAVADYLKPFYLLANETLKKHRPHYDIVLKGIAVGSAAGTATFRGEMVTI